MHSNLKPCHVCQVGISVYVRACPYCGSARKAEGGNRINLPLLALVLIGLGLCGWLVHGYFAVRQEMSKDDPDWHLSRRSNLGTLVTPTPRPTPPILKAISPLLKEGADLRGKMDESAAGRWRGGVVERPDLPTQARRLAERQAAPLP